MTHWNLADCLDEIAAIRGDELALVQGPRRLGWAEVERRARNLAAWMHGARRLPPGQGRDLHLQPSRLHGGRLGRDEGGAGAGERELPLPRGGAALPARQRRRRDRDRPRGVRAAAGERAPRSAEAARRAGGARAGLARRRRSRSAAPTTRRWPARDRPAPPATRSGDDLLLLYTGGTTGMPKGVMWRQHDLYLRLAGGGLMPPPADTGRAARLRARSRRCASAP